MGRSSDTRVSFSPPPFGRSTMDVDQSQLESATALTPHHYPPWVVLMGLGIVAALVISLIQLPPYFRAAVLLRHAETLADHGQDRRAVEFFTNALEVTPSSKRARIGLAVSYFRSPDADDHKKGLGTLEGLTLDKGEWRTLAAVMPAEYQHLFTATK
jgi:hypothetical protein